MIFDVAGQPVSTPAEVRADLTTARKEGKTVVLMRVKGQQGTRFVAIGLGNAS